MPQQRTAAPWRRCVCVAFPTSGIPQPLTGSGERASHAGKDAGFSVFVALGFVVHRHDLERVPHIVRRGQSERNDWPRRRGAHGVGAPRRNMSSEGGAWRVHGTKKGALPIAVEKRPCGKKVTLIANVTNPGALLHELKGRYEKECMG